MYYRQTYMEINLDNLESNLTYLKSLQPNKALFAVIKANAYGLGDYYIAKTVLKAGAAYLCVSSLDEAIRLRNEGITAPILSLGYILKEHFETAKAYNVTVSVDSLDHANDILASGITGMTLHIKIDTGMNRLGFKDVKEVQKAISLLKDTQTIEGIYTHYVDSGNLENPLNDSQYERFISLVKALDYSFRYIHCENSDAIITRKDEDTNAMRAGIAMLGYSSFNKDHLKPIVSLYTKSTLCKWINKGETVSYSATYTADKDTYLVTLPIGYADGFIRKNQGRKVLIDNEEAELVGRICMDQCMIATEKEYPVGSLVEIFGEHIHLDDVAEDLETIVYEVLCNISERVTRIYIKDNKEIYVKNYRLDNTKYE